MARAILFDFGNVIAFFDHRRATRRFAPLSRLDDREIYELLYDNELEQAFEAGHISADEYVIRAMELIGYGGTAEQFRADFVDIFTPNPAVIELIPRLQSTARIVLASNTNPLHSAHFRARFADVLRHFDALGQSFEAGVRKPTGEYYEYCARLAGVPIQQCLFIDDVEKNVQGARAAGLTAIHYTPDVNLRHALAEYGFVAR